jgi:hypothetical protein
MVGSSDLGCLGEVKVRLVIGWSGSGSVHFNHGTGGSVRCELDSAISNYDPAARRRIPLSEQRESEAPPPVAGDK